MTEAVQPVVELGLLVAGDLDPLDALDQCREHDLGYEPSDCVADAEVRSEPERLRTVADLLERATRTLELQQEGSRIAQTNGRVQPPPAT